MENNINEKIFLGIHDKNKNKVYYDDNVFLNNKKYMVAKCQSNHDLSEKMKLLER